MTNPSFISPLAPLQSLSLVTFLILALAVFRLTRLITRDFFFQSLRDKIWESYPPTSSFLGYLFTCEWCISIWVAAPIVFFYAVFPTITFLICCIFSLSAVASLISARLDD